MKAVLRINRFTLAVGVALALLGASAAQAEDGEYGILMKTLSNPFWGAMSQGVEDGAGVPVGPRTGTLATSLIAIPPAEPAVVFLAIGLLLYANGLLSVSASAWPARRYGGGDTD